MSTQWYLCEISEYDEDHASRLKITDNLAVTNPQSFAQHGEWLVWLPIVPRVGDTIQFAGWQVQVIGVVLRADWKRKEGIYANTDVVAQISISSVKHS